MTVITFDNGNITLIHGDCLEIMPKLPANSVDLVLADLPYGTTACKWDSIIPLDRLWFEYSRISRSLTSFALFSSFPFSAKLCVSAINLFKYSLVWEKSKPSNFLNVKNRPMGGHEDILIFSNGTIANGSVRKMTYNPQMRSGKPYKKQQRTEMRRGAWDAGTRAPLELRLTQDTAGQRYPITVLKFSSVVGRSSLHPTQKPVELLEYLIKTYTNEGDVVLDNVMGSGSTGVACITTRRKFIGIEKDETYFRIAVDRCVQALKDRS